MVTSVSNIYKTSVGCIRYATGTYCLRYSILLSTWISISVHPYVVNVFINSLLFHLFFSLEYAAFLGFLLAHVTYSSLIYKTKRLQQDLSYLSPITLTACSVFSFNITSPWLKFSKSILLVISLYTGNVLSSILFNAICQSSSFI